MERLTRSYVHGIGTEPLTAATMGQCLAEAAAALPDGLALIDRGGSVRWTWSELDRRASGLAAALLGLGLSPGDRLAIWAQNRAEWTVTQLAAARAGLILVNLNPAARVAEARAQLGLVGARALVIQDAYKSSDYIAMARALRPTGSGAVDTPPGGDLPELRWVIRMGAGDTPDMIAFDTLCTQATEADHARLTTIAPSIQCDDPANIQFSNATGGKPAGATLTHHNLLNNAATVARTLRLGPGDRLCIPVPLFHCFGMVMGNLACLVGRSTMVYPGEAFDPLDTLHALAEERCTAVHGVPAMFKAMLEQDGFGDMALDSLRTGIMAGAPCPIDTMRQVMDRMHMHEVVIGYGMTESSPIAFMSDVDDAVERRVSTVGTIRPYTEAKVIDADGRIVAPGVTGELCTRGYNIMRGYWNDGELTARVIDEAGWLHTGDLARIDAHGYCQIVGGIKDMAIRGGENISLAEVEEFLRAHPAVADAVVVGVPDARMGEELCACVVLRADQTADADTLRASCRDRIAHYKIPRHFRFYEQFPASTGRALKFMLREDSMAALGLRETATPS